MKNTLFILISSLIFLTSCNESSKNNSSDSTETVSSEDSKTDEPSNTDPANAVEHKDYEEFYESGVLKIAGDFDDQKRRNGLWISYYENGSKWSESFYSKGLKEGHSVTFYPNGKIRYVGEYKNDLKVGHWRFYDEGGTLVREEDYE